MKSVLSIFLIVFFAFPVFALKSDGKVQADWQSKNGKLSVTIRVAEGFHVNEKAPADLRVLPAEKSFPPKKMGAKEVTFILPGKISTAENYVASVYVCDDALTVCEPREWTWNKESGSAESSQGPSVKVSMADQQMKKAQVACEKRENGHLLLEFSARWCPGCMRLQQEVWNQPAIKKTLRSFEVVMMDVDRFATKTWMTKYQVRGIPATLVLNCQGEEVDRVIDFLNAPAMKTTLEDLAKPGVPLKRDLMKLAEEGDSAAAVRLGKRAQWSYQNEESLKWFDKIPANEREKLPEYWNAFLAVHPDVANGQRAIAALPETMSAINWMEDLAELQGPKTPEGQKTLQALVKRVEELMASEEKMKKIIATEAPGESEGIESLHLFEARARALEALDKKEEAMAAWKQAVQEGDRLKIKETPSGPYFRFLSVLKKAGEKERIQKFFEKYASGERPKGDLARRYANYLYDQGDYKKSLSMAKKAMKDSYDQNEIYSAIIYAKALSKNGETKQARQILLKYQARPELEASIRVDLQKSLDGL